ncbi:MAG: S8 family peptidase [Crocinitomicaceae bacterium]|nr:S8 family peptidase [Crocinitomicaceae bacterium]
MRKRIIQLSLAVFAIGIMNVLNAQSVEKDVLNWYNGKNGMQTEKAYKLVKKRLSQPVIVAIVDSGVDTKHEDLKGKIWTNEKEIPGNGIDDDGNGYIDDVHGWNFLGNAKGENQNYARLEKTRILARLSKKYDGVEDTAVADADKKEYDLYKQVKAEVAEERAMYEPYLGQMDRLEGLIDTIPSMVGSIIGKSPYTAKDLNKWNPTDPQGMQLKRMAQAIEAGTLTKEVIVSQKNQINQMLEYNLNVDFEDRTFVGDDPYDMNDKTYGNNDVKGPDALHGTHVGGIVGSVRGNKIGGDGVCENVKLMAVRAVPNGDEFDKDIALSIRYAVDNGAQIINMSFGKSYSPLAKDVYEAFAYADSKGVLLVHAAGNDAKNIDVEPNFPTSVYEFQTKPFDHFLTIGASTRFAKVKKQKFGELAAPFSNYGQKGVDVFAPGAEIYNTVPENKYMSLQGTSMAAPMVSGAAAFMKSYFPNLSMKEIKDILLSTVTNYKGSQQKMPGEAKPIDFGTLSVTGGVINLPAAVKAAIALEKTK